MIVGEGRAGKTALANSIIGKPFSDTASTIGINNLSCSINYADVSNGQWNIYDRPEKELETAIAMSIMEQKLKDYTGGKTHYTPIMNIIMNIFFFNIIINIAFLLTQFNKF